MENERYLVSVPNDTWEFAWKTRDKYLEPRTQSALKLLDLVESRVKERTAPNTIFTNTDYYTELADNIITEIFVSLLEKSKS